MFVRVCVRLSYDTYTETPTHDSFLSFYGSNGEIEKSLINLLKEYFRYHVKLFDIEMPKRPKDDQSQMSISWISTKTIKNEKKL